MESNTTLTSPKVTNFSTFASNDTLRLEESTEKNEDAPVPRDFRFWGVFVALAVSSFTSALDLTAVSTALPVIVNDLKGSEFVWVASAYALCSTAFLPMSGGLAQVFGRRSVMLVSLFLFGLGSILCGAAPSLNFLIAGRELVVQGLGGGGITALTQIIVSDLVSLQERGTFNGLVVLAWAIASFIGPVIGGALAEGGAWRWLFYLNIFTSAISAILVLLLLRLKTPEGTIKEKLGRMDWIGNFLVIAASSSCIIALTWGGVQYSWSSPKVLGPLIVGIIGLGIFFFYEANYATYPIVPFKLLSNVTGLSGYLQTFISAIVLIGAVYYIPVYFQACLGRSPIQSGVDIFALGFILAPMNVVTGLTVTLSKRYRPQLWLGWAVIMISAGLLSTLHATTSRSAALGFEALMGIGLGMIISGTYFPVLAPLPVSENAHALAFFIFVRNFGQVWGVTIGSTILQNYLTRNLPATFIGAFPQGSAVAYSVIPLLDKLPPTLAAETREAFAAGLSLFWKVIIGVGGTGLLTSLLMRHIPLHAATDEKWGVAQSENKPNAADEKV
ncbi:MFS general substrate transporter [Crucibulum laeve]|uniref:MFS general substrate transporter n=1 Tax=Crucibulum laeve TaxID=68775 RepID=A0A5C3LSY8_9AGAR|nr:MFS general substrate transporter [Crucibulum laeve]